MKIRLKFYGAFRSAAKNTYIELNVTNGATVKSLVSQLVAEASFQALKELLLDSSTSDPRPNALILVSGREINALEGVDTVLHEGDEVAMLPIAHGG